MSAEYFQTFGATPQLGRAFTREEERNDVQRVVLSAHLWNAYANRDTEIVGKTVELDGNAYEVIGVMRTIQDREMLTSGVSGTEESPLNGTGAVSIVSIVNLAFSLFRNPEW